MNFEKISLLIIAGGKSSKLGKDKRFLKLGEVGMLESILQKAVKKNFAEIFLCVEKEILPVQILSWRYDAKILVDKIQNFGPLSGLTNGLKKIKTDWALAVSADMPFFDFDALDEIKILSRVRAVIPQVGGKKQPLAGFYHKAAAKIFQDELNNNQTKILMAVEKITHKFIELAADEKIFFNVKTRADLRLAEGRLKNLSRKVPIISIFAPKSNTDKPIFIEKLIEKFSAEKISVGLIKNDAEKFNFDVEKIFKNSCAKNIAIVNPKGWFMIQKTEQREDYLSIAEKMDSVDLILIESHTQKTEPALSLGEVIFDDKVAAIFKTAPESSEEVLQFDLDDLDSAIKICKFLAFN